jgi:recombination protein RecA
MTRAFDVSKFRKDITKSITGISTGFRDPSIWLSTKNYCLNYLISGDFNKGVPLGKVTVFAGESGSGKSYICSGNVVKSAQEQGVFVVLMDAENALDESWLQALNVDTSPEKLMKINVSMIDDVAKTISMFMKEYKTNYDGLPDEERPTVLFVVDSLGMLLTPTDVDQFNKGDMKGDMGRKPKALAALVRNTVNMIAPYDIGLLATNHTYASQDMFSPDDKISGGQGFVYASSILVAMKKKKLKDKDLGGTGSEVKGIKASCKVVKSRYSKPFESVDIFIPYDKGMNEYSGLFDLFEKTGLLVKTGNRYRYVSKVTGEEIIEFRKKWEDNTDLLDQVMDEFEADDLELKVELNEDGEVEHELAG